MMGILTILNVEIWHQVHPQCFATIPILYFCYSPVPLPPTPDNLYSTFCLYDFACFRSLI